MIDRNSFSVGLLLGTIFGLISMAVGLHISMENEAEIKRHVIEIKGCNKPMIIQPAPIVPKAQIRRST